MPDTEPYNDGDGQMAPNDISEASTGASNVKHCYFYPDVAETYGHGPTYIDLFNTDQHATKRLETQYWPFASKGDWEMGSWLLRSGLSMRTIDDFLCLEKVQLFIFNTCIVLTL